MKFNEIRSIATEFLSGKLFYSALVLLWQTLKNKFFLPPFLLRILIKASKSSNLFFYRITLELLLFSVFLLVL